jgi:radical SAM superfamily enzyme YgiQ (UPF0313 family)
MKILLIDPPFYRIMGFYNRYFPYGLVSLGTYLKSQGHEVSVYDADCTAGFTRADFTRLPDHYPGYLAVLRDDSHPVWQEVIQTIIDYQPDLVGIAIWTTFAASAFKTAELVKKVSQGTPVVMGGPHAMVKGKEILSIAPAVDYVIQGEGEHTLTELAKALATPDYNLGLIAGLLYRKEGQVLANPVRQSQKNLDEFTLPYRALLRNENRYTSEDLGLVMTSRGCPFSCSYCVTDRKVGYRSVEQVLEEIWLVRERYRTTYFSFKDDSFTVNRHRVEEFCSQVQKQIPGITWECNTRVDLVDKDLLQKMKASGCISIKIGIESGSDRILGKIDKGITREQIITASRVLKAIGIHWTGYFMMGLPGETEKDIRATLSFMQELEPDFASLAVYEPFPGTKLFVEGIERGIVKPDISLTEFNTILPNHYYKTDPALQTDTIGPNEFAALEQEMKWQFHQYNRQIKKVIKRGFSRTGVYLRQPSTIWSDIKKYLSWK